MAGIFGGLEMAKRALLAHQTRLGVISHNIANAATPGYRRQQVRFETTPALRVPQGFLGTGTTVAAIRSQANPFFDRRAAIEKSTLGRYAAQHSGLQQMEAVLARTSEIGIGARLADFWNNWNELANRPTEPAARMGVVNAARDLARAFNSAHNDLEQVRAATHGELMTAVEDVNRLAVEVAELNRRIADAELAGHPANDLRDRRALLVEELSQLAGATAAQEDEHGMISVHIGGRFLVDGTKSFSLRTETDTVKPASGRLSWSDGRPLQNLGGRLAGLLQTRDVTVPDAQARLDQLAVVLMQSVNAIHDDGSGNLNIFEGTGAADLAIGAAIDADESAVRAGTGEVGDNSIALAIAELRDRNQSELGGSTINDRLALIVGRVGSQTREMSDLIDTQAEVLIQVENARQAISGVSLDEEAADLVMAQRAFQAAAQVVNTLDSMLETVIFTMAR